MCCRILRFVSLTLAACKSDSQRRVLHTQDTGKVGGCVKVHPEQSGAVASLHTNFSTREFNTRKLDRFVGDLVTMS